MADYYNLYGYLNLFLVICFLYLFSKKMTHYILQMETYTIFLVFIHSNQIILLQSILWHPTLIHFIVPDAIILIFIKKKMVNYILVQKNNLFHQLRGYQLTNPVLQEELDDFLSELNILCAPLTPYYGTGRRKKAVARVFLYEGTGKITINHRKATEYFSNIQHAQTIQHPFLITSTSQLFDAYITVKGGGIAGQAGAIRHGISRALLKYDLEYRTILKAEGFLTRDSRMKERKKPGMKGARKSPQFSKR